MAFLSPSNSSSENCWLDLLWSTHSWSLMEFLTKKRYIERWTKVIKNLDFYILPKYQGPIAWTGNLWIVSSEDPSSIQLSVESFCAEFFPKMHWFLKNCLWKQWSAPILVVNFGHIWISTTRSYRGSWFWF